MIWSDACGIAGISAQPLCLPGFSSLRFLCLRYHGFSEGSVFFPFLPGTGVLDLDVPKHQGRTLGGLQISICISVNLPLQSNTPPLYDIPSQRNSQAFFFSSGLCSAGIQRMGAVCFFFFPFSCQLWRAENPPKKILDWPFSSWYSAWQRLDWKQDSIQPQAGPTC